MSESVPDEDEVSETVKLVEGFESLVQDGAVFWLEECLDRLLFDVGVDLMDKSWLRDHTKDLFWWEEFSRKIKDQFKTMRIGQIFEYVNFSFFQKLGLVIGKFHDILKFIIREKFVEEIDIFFGLNNFYIFAFNGINKFLKIRTIVINELINECFSKDILLLFF